MANYILVVLTNAQPGRDDDFNAWYDDVHLRDVCAVPGILAARRYMAAPIQPAPDGARWRYLAIYEIETDNLQGVMDEMNARAGTDQMFVSDSLDVAGACATVFGAFSEQG
ncbi:DUF4286 family protein [Novosphingobium sp. PASSN1]|uniref:DUF4286 family protein n=1 Tax=Novosphingobium sp. PASSN1 TaxID=2015561 RepID=UPI000BCB0DDF|nr:DUF4286 family protein [Novosphingobium sp. PASSN1]OYU34742.1 MAG: hypothetical protein CFE35_12680 [Novosphingobium sp. PASSN1]